MCSRVAARQRPALCNSRMLQGTAVFGGSGRALIAMALVVGCAINNERQLLILPEVTGARSVLIVVDRRPVELRVFAEDLPLDAAFVPPVSLTHREDAVVWALFYDAPLIELDLSPGELAQPADDQGGPLPRATSAVFRADVGARFSRAWSPSAWDGSLESVLLTALADQACPRFEPRVLSTEKAAFGVLASDRALLGLKDGGWLVVSPAGQASTVGSGGAIFVAGAVGGAGHLHAVAQDGAVWRSDDADPATLTLVAAATTSSQILQLVVVEDPGKEERIAAFDTEGAIRTLVNDRWQETARLSCDPSCGRNDSASATASVAAIANEWSRSFAWVTQSAVALEPLPDRMLVTSLLLDGEWGLLAGTESGEVMRHEASGLWRTLVAPLINTPVTALARHGRWILGATRAGVVYALDPSGRSCAPETAGSFSIRGIVSLGGAVLVFGQPAEAGASETVVLLTPR